MSLSAVNNLRGLVSDASLLVRQEIELAKAEAGEKLEQVQSGVISVVSGLLIAFVALIVLVQALVVALSNVMPPSIASLLVGVLLATIGLVAVTMGINQLKAKNLKPSRTISSIKNDAETLSGA